jgi:hypothetical protein
MYPLRICFVVSSFSVGSAHLRGVQVSNALVRLGIDSQVHSWLEFEEDAALHLSGFDVYLFVKEWNHDIALKIKNDTNCKVVLDILDNYLLHDRLIRRDSKYELIDALIVSNTHHKIALHCLGFGVTKPIWVIPHHHTNFHCWANNTAKPVQCIGFQGDITNRLPEELEQDLRDFCNSRGMKWRAFYTHTTQESCAHLSPTEINTVIHEQLRSIDIGIIFPPVLPDGITGVDERVWRYLLFKPATRLINFFSHGIPTICYPYVSFLEACVDSGYSLFCCDKKSLFRLLEQLVIDGTQRQLAAEQGMTIASKYSLDRIIPAYYTHLSSLDSARDEDSRL